MKIRIGIVVLFFALCFSGCRPKVEAMPPLKEIEWKNLACIHGEIFMKVEAPAEYYDYEWPGKADGTITEIIDHTKEFRWKDGTWVGIPYEAEALPYAYVNADKDVIMVNYSSTGEKNKDFLMYYFCDVKDFSWKIIYPEYFEYLERMENE